LEESWRMRREERCETESGRVASEVFMTLRLCRRVRYANSSGGRPDSIASFVSTRPSRHGNVLPMSDMVEVMTHQHHVNPDQ
jgi:hypothetical protein